VQSILRKNRLLKLTMIAAFIASLWLWSPGKQVEAQSCPRQVADFEDLVSHTPTAFPCSPSAATVNTELVTINLSGGTMYYTGNTVNTTDQFGFPRQIDQVEYVNSTLDLLSVVGYVGCYYCDPFFGGPPCPNPPPPQYSNSITIQFSQPVTNVTFGLSNFNYPFATTFAIDSDNGSHSTVRIYSAAVENLVSVPSTVNQFVVSVPYDINDFGSAPWAFGISEISFTPFVSTPKGQPSIKATPTIGAPGDLVTVIGSNWPSPTAPSQYVFFFDGQEISQRQSIVPCQAFQPSTQFQVPLNKTVGSYSVRVEQRPGSTIQTLAPPGGGSLSATATYTVQNDIKLSAISAIPKDHTASVMATLTPSPRKGQPLTLRLSAKTGTTGSAVFVTSTGTATTLDVQETTTVMIKGLTESSEVNNIVLEALDRGKVLTTQFFTVFKIDSIEISMPPTKNPVTGARPTADTKPITNTSLAFATATTPDLIVLFQSNQPNPQVKAIGVTPESVSNLLRWEAKRDDKDTVGTSEELPLFNKVVGSEILLTPHKAGNFNVICYYDSNNNSRFDNGEELKVLHMAVVRITILGLPLIFAGEPMLIGAQGIEPGTTKIKAQEITMGLQMEVLLEGGGDNRLIGIDQIKLGDVGNLIHDDSQVNYPVPTPTPQPPGNVAGIGIENPGGPLPMVDTTNVLKDQTTSGKDSAFRGSSKASLSLNQGPVGRKISIGCDDNPDFGPWNIIHKITRNPWADTQGGYKFREFIVGYSDSFPKYYVVIATGDWTSTAVGHKDTSINLWVDDRSEVTVGGQAATMTEAPLIPKVTDGSPLSGDDAGIQVQGLSYGYQHFFEYK
jgi:hypothetical protein